MSEEKIEFKAGDVVQLKSGGPLMTVYCIYLEDLGVSCGWFYEGEYKNYTFLAHQLKHAGELQ